MQENIKPWQVAVAIVFFVTLCGFSYRSQSVSSAPPSNIPAGKMAATRTPEPDELMMPKTAP